MRIRFSYGKEGVALTLPDDRNVTVLRARRATPIRDVEAATLRALAEPIESKPLSEIARGRKDACIVISDITRPVPNRLILPPILRTLEEAGIAREAITILIATGIHRPNEGEELVELVGEEIAGAVRCVNHFGQDEEACALVGRTRAGIPIYVNKIYLQADLKILTGLIEPHLWAGFSGGRKAILPGITSIKTMQSMHGVEMIDACQANCGTLEGNAFHEAGLEVAAMVGVDFILNATVDESRAVTGVFAGHYDAAHRAGCGMCAECTGFELEEPADLVIASNGGYPLDKTFYQSVSGMSVAWLMLREGGRSLTVAECSEGVGSAQFREVLEMADSPEAMLELLGRPGFFMVDQWSAQCLARILMDNRVAVHAAGVTGEKLRRYGCESVEDPQAWLDAQLEALPREAKIVAVPDGPYIYGRVVQPAR